MQGIPADFKIGFPEDLDYSALLGIEEPETNLRPQAQKRFVMSLTQELDNKETSYLHNAFDGSG